MNLGVLSDTHGKFHKFIESVHLFRDLDILVHLGDHYRDAEAIREQSGLRVEAVTGNTDVDEFPWIQREKLLEVEDTRILITHGDIYRVKHGLELLYDRAVELSANVVLFGHTHTQECRRVGNILFVNPGAALSCNGGNGMALLRVLVGRVEARMISL